MQDAGEQEAEACLLHSLAVARQQEAKSLELPTAMNLGRLWQQQDKRRQAYGLSAPIYDWFSEGFDTPGGPKRCEGAARGAVLVTTSDRCGSLFPHPYR